MNNPKFEEIRMNARNEIYAVREKYKENMEEHLRETNLDKIVKRKYDGRIGKLQMVEISYGLMKYALEFYPITKKGTVSMKSDGCIDHSLELTEQFEPYKED